MSIPHRIDNEGAVIYDDSAAYETCSPPTRPSWLDGEFFNGPYGTSVAPELPMPKPRRKNNSGGVAVETAPQNAGDTTAGNIDRERVAQRAYELYLARGGADGMAMEDWLAAERELTQGADFPLSES
jgi:hypothetical protein